MKELAEAKWAQNPFKQYYLKKAGRNGGYVLTKNVCSCGKKSNSQCKGVLCVGCCAARGEPCKAHKSVSKARGKEAKERKAGPKKGAKAAKRAAAAAEAAALIRP